MYLAHFLNILSIFVIRIFIRYSCLGIPGCGGTLTSDIGEFSVPTLSNRYSHNVECDWVIRVPPGETIELKFTSFHVEQSSTCRWDYVEVLNFSFLGTKNNSNYIATPKTS